MNFNDDYSAGLSYKKQPVKDSGGFLELDKRMADDSFTGTKLAMQSRPMYHVTNTGQKPLWQLAAEQPKCLKVRYVKNIDSTRCM